MTKNSDKSRPSYQLELAALKKYSGPIAGVDEAGRGPWAGPVVAAAVILDGNNIPAGLDDSKKLNAGKRLELFQAIQASSLVGIGIAEVARIDRDNILQATLWAMAKAVDQLKTAPKYVLVDGNKCPDLNCPAQSVVKGDSRSVSIAAASIIAKVTRDRIMDALSIKHPEFGWQTNKGYGTKQHIFALEAFGITSHHRRSFKPIQKFVV